MSAAIPVTNSKGRPVDVPLDFVYANIRRFQVGGGWKLNEFHDDLVNTHHCVYEIPSEKSNYTTGKIEAANGRGGRRRNRPAVVHLCEGGLDFSGATEFIKALVRHQSSYADVYVMTGTGVDPAAWDVAGVVVETVKDDAAVRRLREIDPDIIHDHMPRRRWLCGVVDDARRVATPHKWIDQERFATEMPDYAIPISGDSPNVIRHGVNLELFKPPKRRQRKSKKTPLTIGVVGRIAPDKIPTEFVTELEKFQAKNPGRAQWFFCGPVAGMPEAQEIYRRLKGVPACEIMRALPRAELPALYRSLDLLVVPSKAEAACFAAIEAMACGCAVFGFDSPGLRETVGDDGAGLLFGAMPNIFLGIEHVTHRSLWERGATGRARAVRLFDQRRMLAQYDTAYELRSTTFAQFARKREARKSPVVAGIASIARREETCRITVESLLPQVDALHLWLNDYPSRPAWTKHPKITVYHRRGNRHAFGKFAALETIGDAYFFTCDDDIIYPPDYVQRMVDFLESRNRWAVACVMGAQMQPPIEDLSHNHRTHCYNAGLAEPTAVDCAGTGTTAFHTSVIGRDFFDTLPTRVNGPSPFTDFRLSAWARDKHIPIFAVARGDQWLREQRDPDGGIWQANRDDKWRAATAFAASIWTPETRRVGVYLRGQGGLGDVVMTTPLIQQFPNPVVYFDADYQWLDEVRALLPFRVETWGDAAWKECQKIYAPWGGKDERFIKPKTNWLSSGAHAADCFLSCIENPVRKLTTVRTEPCDVWGSGKPRIAIANGSNAANGWTAKRWPRDHFVTLTAMIRERYPDVEIKFFGDAENAEWLGEIEGVESWAGRLSVAETAHALSLADAAVVNDTGLAHVADAVGCPTIEIFGFTKPGKCRPYNNNTRDVVSNGGGCSEFGRCYADGVYRSCRNNACVKAVTPDRVFVALCNVLDADPSELPVAVIEYGGERHSMRALTRSDLMFQRWERSGQFYELDLLETIASRARAGVFIDVGANLGNHSRFFAHHTAATQVIAIEGNAALLQALTSNANGPNVATIHAVVSDHAGAYQTTGVNPANTGSTAFVEADAGVDSIALDSLGLANVAVIKIDVEGMEPAVLRGALATITRDRPLLACEAATSADVAAINEILEPLGYRRDTHKYGHTPTFIWEHGE